MARASISQVDSANKGCRSVGGNRLQGEMNHAGLKGQSIWIPRGR